MRTTPVKFSLGWEFEASKASVITPDGVDRGSDGSVNGEGVEYRTKISEVFDPRNSIKKLGDLLSLKRLEVNSSCGFHVHVGLASYPKSYTGYPGLWASWNVVLAKEIENDIFAIVPESRRENNTCKKWSGVNLPHGIIKQRYGNSKYDGPQRYYWVNVTEIFRKGGIKTVEIRLMGDTKNYAFLVGWMCFCIIMAKSAYKLIGDPLLLNAQVERLKQFALVLSSLKTAKGEKAKLALANLLSGSGITLPGNSSIQEAVNILEEGAVKKNSPQPNEHAVEVIERARWHKGSSYYNEMRNRISRGQTPHEQVKKCKCDSCNFLKYSLGDKVVPAELPVGGVIDNGADPVLEAQRAGVRQAFEEMARTNVPPFNISGQLGRLEGVSFAQNPPLPSSPIPRPESNVNLQSGRAMHLRRRQGSSNTPQPSATEMTWTSNLSSTSFGRLEDQEDE